MPDKRRSASAQASGPKEDWPAPRNVLDPVVWGRLLRSLRIMRGYDRLTDLARLLRQNYGVEVSDRTLYAIERGEQIAHMDLCIAVSDALQSPVGWWDAALRADIIRNAEDKQARR